MPAAQPVPYDRALTQLREQPGTWLVTGCAGFIGSSLVQHLLQLGQSVVGIDNFATGYRHNLDDVRALAGEAAWRKFRFIEGDVCNLDTCREACRDVDYVLQQSAIGSVQRSIADPIRTNSANVDGFLNMLVAARDANVRRFIFAASSSTYGDHPGLPKVEDRIGKPLSPYAVSKYVNELYASVFHRTYGMETVGLRYFNVFGRRQDPDGAYAAVIPRWITQILHGRRCSIYGDGETSRDFCYIDNVIQANLLAALAEPQQVAGEVFNIAYGGRTTLNQLYELIVDGLRGLDDSIEIQPVEYEGFRVGDVRHSQADISKAMERLGYQPTHSVQQGLAETLAWYVERARATWSSS